MKQAAEDITIVPIARILGTVAALGAVAGIGFVDRATGGEISFSIFYLLPVSLAFWLLGLLPGVVTAAAGATVWLVADLNTGVSYSHLLIPYANALMRGIIFLAVGLLLVRLRRSLERETRLATRDALTGIGNWRHFEAVAGRELGRARRSGGPLSLVYLDLDNFKSVNDSLGHQAGDALLVSMASALQESVRTIDCVARLGGDEFAVLMPDTAAEGARAVVERMRSVIRRRLEVEEWPATVSAGLVTFVRPPASIDEMIKAADDLMYDAKKNGKDAVAGEVLGELPS
jgi:diguanylate cyclase (GGDEF)-like protein